MDWRFGEFAVGKGRKLDAANDANGGTVALAAGTYLMTVYGEPCRVVRNSANCADGEGSRLPADFACVVRITSGENWAARSAGGTGVVEFTRSGSGVTGI